jgi:hypothetical protein
MTLSQNGWTAYEDTSRFVRGEACGFKFWAANADVAVLFTDYIEWYDAEIEPVDGPTLDDWSYANRLVRGSTSTVSNHGSATAIDINALKHPRGVPRTFSSAHRKTIEARIGTYGGALRSGEFYSTTVDGMHIEINTDRAGAKAAADKIRARLRAESEANDVSFDDKHTLTAADVAAYGSKTLKPKVDQKSYDELVRFPPATERLRREMTAQIGALTGLVSQVLQLVKTGGTLTEAQAVAAAETGARAALAELGDALDGK